MHRHLDRARSRSLVISLLVTTTLVACSSGSSDAKKATPPTASQPAPTRDLRILVTNDDGYDAPGIDAVAQALSVLPSVDVTIVAPATNKSGTGSNTTPGTLTATDQQTTSGLPVTSRHSDHAG